ncbi:MAG TPA: exodeoxyribonuclease VII small subunit [Candidatus Saccharibacteria bacterium]|nr:exodeoxyribonuclease VII small subunit [Candidatus Saccharibacteria bacterium]
MTELRALVAWFESDEFQLEAASAKFTEASKLAKEIEEDLAKLKNTVNVLKQSFDS